MRFLCFSQNWSHHQLDAFVFCFPLILSRLAFVCSFMSVCFSLRTLPNAHTHTHTHPHIYPAVLIFGNRFPKFNLFLAELRFWPAARLLPTPARPLTYRMCLLLLHSTVCLYCSPESEPMTVKVSVYLCMLSILTANEKFLAKRHLLGGWAA